MLLAAILWVGKHAEGTAMYNLFDDPEARKSYQHVIGIGFDERAAFIIASVDSDFRKRVRTGFTPVEAYAKTLGELASFNALMEGYGPDVRRRREKEVYEKTKRD
jgi:hypothetical protein